MISWSTKRRLSIFAGILVIILFLVWLVWFFFFRSPVSCFDGLKNGDELGLDCGGSCYKVCKEEVVPISTLWSKVFPLREGVVNVAALVENPNSHFSVRSLRYVFKIYDKDNVLIAEKTGKTFANANERFLILEPQISVGNLIPVRAFIELESPTWERLAKAQDPIAVTVRQTKLVLGDEPRLMGRIENVGVRPLYDLTVLALVVDKDENAIAVSSTFVNSLQAGKGSDLVFTWPTAFTKDAVAASLYPRIDRTK